MALLKEEEREVLMLEYKELLNEILQRRQITWLINSIFLASTFIISFRPNPDLLPLPFIVSLVLVTIAWSFQITGDRVDKSCWNRRHEIEKKLGMLWPKRRLEELEKSWRYKIRHALWHLLFAILMLVYFFLLLDYFVLKLLPL